MIDTIQRLNAILYPGGGFIVLASIPPLLRLQREFFNRPGGPGK